MKKNIVFARDLKVFDVVRIHCEHEFIRTARKNGFMGESSYLFVVLNLTIEEFSVKEISLFPFNCDFTTKGKYPVLITGSEFSAEEFEKVSSTQGFKLNIDSFESVCPQESSCCPHSCRRRAKNFPIKNMGLSPRVQNVLMIRNLHTAEELSKIPRRILKKGKGIGIVSMKEIDERLAALGLSLDD